MRYWSHYRNSHGTLDPLYYLLMRGLETHVSLLTEKVTANLSRNGRVTLL